MIEEMPAMSIWDVLSPRVTLIAWDWHNGLAVPPGCVSPAKCYSTMLTQAGWQPYWLNIIDQTNLYCRTNAEYQPEREKNRRLSLYKLMKGTQHWPDRKRKDWRKENGFLVNIPIKRGETEFLLAKKYPNTHSVSGALCWSRKQFPGKCRISRKSGDSPAVSFIELAGSSMESSPAPKCIDDFAFT